MAFDDVRLPVDIERGAVGGPGFRTTVITLANGDEQRNEEWSRTRGEWNISYGMSSRNDLAAVYDFFLARHGRARGFRFRNWLDYKATAQPVGILADPTQRQIVRVYPDDVNPYTSVITHPVADTVKVFVNGVATTAFTLLPLGVLQFDSDPGENVLVTFEYDIPVRFDTDKLDVRINTENSSHIPTIIIVELRQ